MRKVIALLGLLVAIVMPLLLFMKRGGGATAGYRKLKWDDYKKKPPEPRPKEDGVPLKAVTSSGLVLGEFSCEEGVIPNVAAEFDPDESWVDPGSKTDDLLKHEQGHHDLDEIAARKLKKELDKLRDELKNATTKEKCDAVTKKINDLFDKANKELGERQKKYEDETKHGTDPDKQQDWDKKIAGELKAA